LLGAWANFAHLTMDDDEEKLVSHTNGGALISVLEVTELPKELQTVIADYVDFTTADCYADFHAFATTIREMMCTPDFYIEVTARKSCVTEHTLHVPLASVLKLHDVPLSSQELSDLFLRSKKSFRMVQLDQILSRETRTHLYKTVVPFIKQRASLRFPPGLTPAAYIYDSKRTLETRRNFNCLSKLLLTLLCLAIPGAIGCSSYFAVSQIGSLIALPVVLSILCLALCRVRAEECCDSHQKARDDTTIKQTWVWGVEENEDFRETLKDVVAQARLK